MCSASISPPSPVCKGLSGNLAVPPTDLNHRPGHRPGHTADHPTDQAADHKPGCRPPHRPHHGPQTRPGRFQFRKYPAPSDDEKQTTNIHQVTIDDLTTTSQNDCDRQTVPIKNKLTFQSVLLSRPALATPVLYSCCQN